MYRYDESGCEMVLSRVKRFRIQVGQHLSGALTEDQFRPPRLQNGLYLQLHAYVYTARRDPVWKKIEFNANAPTCPHSG